MIKKRYFFAFLFSCSLKSAQWHDLPQEIIKEIICYVLFSAKTEEEMVDALLKKCVSRQFYKIISKEDESATKIFLRRHELTPEEKAFPRVLIGLSPSEYFKCDWKRSSIEYKEFQYYLLKRKFLERPLRKPQQNSRCPII